MGVAAENRAGGPALVTGGAGFIGSNLVDALLARGERVIALDDLSSGRRENLAGALAAGAELIEGDVADAGTVATVFDRHRPTVVYHLAAQIDVRVSVADPRFDLTVNVGGTLNLLDTIRERGAQTRIVLASTGGAIYGEGEAQELPFAEDAACRPDAPYGQSKHAAEGYLGVYARLHALSAVALRLGNVYGPRQDPHGEAGVVAMFTGAMLGGLPYRVYGDGEQTRDYVFVGDVVEAFLAAAASAGGGALNVGTGVETSVNDLGELLAHACGVEFAPDRAPARAGEVQRTALDPSRAGVELGWRATTELGQGLEATVDSIRAAGG